MKLILTAAVIVGLGLAAGACAEIPASTAMPEVGLMAAPAGWVDYCQRHHAEDTGCR